MLKSALPDADIKVSFVLLFQKFFLKVNIFNENMIFLMVGEPLKHINIDLIHPKFIFVCSYDTTFDFGMFHIADNNWLNSEINGVYLSPVAPCIMNTRAIKTQEVWSVPNIILWYYLSFPSKFMWCEALFDWTSKRLCQKS